MVMATSERQVVYKSVVVASQDIETNTVLTPKILEVRVNANMILQIFAD
jgi:hypothetical protein